jgi:hypothetical protein
MRGINPEYLENLDDGQQEFILTSHGKFFADHFIFVDAEHGFVIGPTGSGKTNKNYNLVNWLKHTEVILWISASKDQDIVPLFFMGLPVNIIIPKYAGIEITLDGLPVNNVTYSEVNDPSDVFYAIKKDHINILEVRNAFFDRGKLLDWMIQLFGLIAEWTRTGQMPRFRPDTKSSGESKITVFIDESQWLIAGSKVTSDPKRTKATEIISESALEIRTYGWRFVISSQGFTNVPPIIRENMACTFLCSGADIKDVPELRDHCYPKYDGFKGTSLYDRNEWKFVNRKGEAHPKHKPLPTPLFPKNPEDRETASRIKIKYARTYHDKNSDDEEIVFSQPFPELGKLSDVMLQEAKPEDKGYNSRYSYPGEINNVS